MINKKPLIVIFFLMAFIFGACGINVDIDVEKGSGNVITETRDVSGFDRVSLTGIGDVTLTQGDQEELQIEAEDNLIPHITTEVRDGTLYIGFDRKSIIPTEPVRFNLTMRDIRGLSTSGVSSLEADQIKTDQIEIGISGTGNIEIDDLSADRLTTNVSGAGNFTVAGKVASQNIKLSGAGNYDGEDLESEDAEVTITGLGKVVVWAAKNIDVTISGTGSVEYYGDPQVSQHISGLGRIRHAGDK